MLIKCMRARGLIVIVESKNGSIATLQPLKHVLRNPEDRTKVVGETFHNLAGQLTKTLWLIGCYQSAPTAKVGQLLHWG